MRAPPRLGQASRPWGRLVCCVLLLAVPAAVLLAAHNSGDKDAGFVERLYSIKVESRPSNVCLSVILRLICVPQ